MLPLVPGFTSEVIDAARRERRTGPLELPVHTAAQPQAGRGTERDADDALEHRAGLVPATAGTGLGPSDQRTHDHMVRAPCGERVGKHVYIPVLSVSCKKKTEINHY